MTGICIVGEWTERACVAGVIGATAASLRQADGPAGGIELGLRLAATDGWRLGVFRLPQPAVTQAVEVDRFDEEPERWDGLS